MLFAFTDDGSLEVVADTAEANQRFEGYDVESGAVRLFESAGLSLKPHFPHRSDRRFLGIRISDAPGSYALVPASEGSRESLHDLLPLVTVLTPNRWFKDLGAVRTHLAAARDQR